jgi:hypothetical protein
MGLVSEDDKFMYRAIVDYCEQVGRGERSLGLVIYPPALDVRWDRG